MNNLEKKKYKGVDKVISTWGTIHQVLFFFILVILQPTITYIFEKFQIRWFIINELTVSLTIAYFIGSLFFTKWHLWAFKNTKKEDWIELEQRAFEKRAISKKNYWYRTKHQKQLIKELTNEIERLRNDKNLPPPKIDKKWFEKFDISKHFDISNSFDFLLLFTATIIFFVFKMYFN